MAVPALPVARRPALRPRRASTRSPTRRSASLLVALLLAYSRGALLALVIGCALWFALVPLRLRGVAVLATRRPGAALVVGRGPSGRTR